MSRIFLAGLGDSIPPEALPDPSSGDLPPMRLVLTEDGFDKVDWVGLGYTHFEVWCIGAAGGHGSNGFGGVSWPYYESGGVQHWHDPYLDGLYGYGGGGGGGGLHHFAGLLADLPGVTAVVIGDVGADGVDGYLETNAPVVVDPPFMPGSIYDLPHKTFYPAGSGSDGGPSSFNGAMCKASGGKGGGPAGVYNPGAPPARKDTTWQGFGAEGGIGNRTTPGGGAAGSSTTANGADGIWDGDVGSGGGGGRGGTFIGDDPGTPGYDPVIRQASSGGQGSYSFADTTVYGNRETRDGYKAGGGGGAKVGSLQYGSHAIGFDPNGAVIIRLTKIV